MKLPKGTNGILWQLAFRDICEQLGYVYENGVVTDIKTGVVSCPFETSEIVEYLKLLHKLYQEKKLVALDDGENSEISNMKFAVWMGYTRDEVFERVKDNTKIVQLPYLFFTRTSGSTGVNKISKKKNEAIQLLSLLYTDSKYANLLIHGKKGKTYQLKNGYAYDMEGNHLLTFGEKGKDGDDWLAYVSQIMEIPEGFFGIDANMRDLYIWGPDASVLGSVEAPDLFGARYAWIAGAAKQDDGSILVALTQDRDDDSATELLLYRLSGF